MHPLGVMIFPGKHLWRERGISAGEFAFIFIKGSVVVVVEWGDKMKRKRISRRRHLVKGNILICAFKRLHLAAELNHCGVRHRVHLVMDWTFTRERKHSLGDGRCFHCVNPLVEGVWCCVSPSLYRWCLYASFWLLISGSRILRASSLRDFPTNQFSHLGGQN